MYTQWLGTSLSESLDSLPHTPRFLTPCLEAFGGGSHGRIVGIAGLPSRPEGGIEFLGADCGSCGRESGEACLECHRQGPIPTEAESDPGYLSGS